MFVDELTPGVHSQAEVPLDAIGERIGRLAAEINAATCRWLGLIAEFDRRKGHEQWGFASCSAWLAWRCGLNPRSAREHVRVAGALEGLRLIRREFERGCLSYSKLRALTRVATPEMETDLLEIAAEASAAQLERVLRGYAGAISEADEAQVQRRRGLDVRWEEDGSLRLSGTLTAEEGALFVEALDAAREELWRDGGPDRPDRADALVAMAESAMAAGLQARPGGDRHQVIVHVEVATLTGDGAEEAAGTAGGRPAAPTVGDGGLVSSETARRLACDASIVPLIEKDGAPLSVGRKTRAIPPAIARALRARDRGCRFPGCERSRFVDAHHIEHWAQGGSTSMDNLVQLCRHHHRAIHAGRFRIQRSGDDLFFRRADGSVVDPAPSLPAVRGGWMSGPRHTGRSASATGPIPAGMPIDYDFAVAGLARRAESRGVVGPRVRPPGQTAARAPAPASLARGQPAA